MKIDIDTLKQISIVDMLSRNGVEPVSVRGTRAMYRSPFRPDTNPSFAVDIKRNLWMDHGSGEGGSVIDLCMKMNDLSYVDAIKRLSSDSDTLRLDGIVQQRVAGNSGAGVPAIDIYKVQACGRNPVISAYLMERGIPAYIAALTPQLREVYYKVGDKKYYGLGFKNDAGGYELRNKYFKGCGGKKAITTIDNGSDSVVVVEGFMDYVALVAWQQQSVRMNVVVLNSTAMLSKALPFLEKHGRVFTMLDNDEAGDLATEKLKAALGDKVIDKRGDYRRYKDFNEFLVARNQEWNRRRSQQGVR